MKTHKVKLKNRTEIPAAIANAMKPQSPVSLSDALAAADAATRSLVVVFVIDERGGIRMDRFAKNFLTGKLPEAVNLLRDNLAEEFPYEFNR